jgi:catechol 2,3-dioxygenase-like lactoylglutathione lyase family enzyme
MAFTHIMVGAKDVAQGKSFYDTVLGTLGWPAGHEFRPGTVFYSHNGAAFGVGNPADGGNATHANGGTIGFAAQSKEQVDAFHAAGLANGGSCEGLPGKRPGAPGNAYGAYLRDPTGNKICTFCQLPEGA